MSGAEEGSRRGKHSCKEGRKGPYTAGGKGQPETGVDEGRLTIRIRAAARSSSKVTRRRRPRRRDGSGTRPAGHAPEVRRSEVANTCRAGQVGPGSEQEA